MKNGLNDNCAGKGPCDFSKTFSVTVKDGKTSNYSLTRDKYLPRSSDVASSQYYQLLSTSPIWQSRHVTNAPALLVAGQSSATLDFDSHASGASTADNIQRLPRYGEDSSKHILSLYSLSNYTPFSSVRALSSTLQDDSDQSKTASKGQGPEQVAACTPSSSSFQYSDHEDVVPICPRPRANMPFITPIHREGEFICGWGAAFINICVTFPINKAIFRQQLHGISGLRAIRQLRKDGLQYLYRGLLPPLLQKTMSLSVMFGMYFHCQDVLGEHFPTLGVVPNHAIAAMISGTLEATLMPFERIQTLMQNREFHNRFTNTPDAFRHLWSYGFKEYYRGLSLVIWRNGPSNVAFFLGREYIQDVTPQPDSHTKKMLRDFLSGACLGAMISTVFFPLNVVKTRMQSKLGGVHESGWATLKVVLAERRGRLKELFRGVHLNYTRSFISWGIINASFEVLIRLYNGESWTQAS